MGDEPATLIEVLEEGFKRYASDETIVATKRNGNWVETSAASFLQQIGDFALGLYDLGVRPGDRVSLHSENSAEWLICDFALQSIGAVSVPIYTTQPGEQIGYILNNSGARVHIVSGDDMFTDTRAHLDSIPDLESIISIRETEDEKIRRYSAVLKIGQKRRKQDPELLDQLKSAVEPDTLVTLIYTSGTTGTPKGVMLTHNNIASNIRASLTRVPFSLDDIPGQNVLSYLPLSHVFERMMSYLYLVMGARIHYIEKVDEIRDDFLYVRPYFLATVPRLLEKVYNGIKAKGQELGGVKKRLYYWAVALASGYDPEQGRSGVRGVKMHLADRLVYGKMRELFGGNLTGMISGGAPLSPDLFRFVNGIGLFCGQGYGLTETSPVIAVQDRNHLRVGSCGLPLPGVEVKIAEDGEILVRGPNVMKGYYRDAEQTADVIDEDGWFSTGDVGNLDEEGNLFITDRIKDLFKLSTGKYVAPQNIETALVNSSYIEQAVVTGFQRKFCSALIVPAYENVIRRLKRNGYQPEKPYQADRSVRSLIEAEIEKVNRSLSPWESVKRFHLLDRPLTVESGELTPTMKVKRNIVYEKYLQEIEAMYEEEAPAVGE